MISGLKVGDDSWDNMKLKVKNNVTFMLMGSADSLPEAPTNTKVETIYDCTYLSYSLIADVVMLAPCTVCVTMVYSWLTFLRGYVFLNRASFDYYSTCWKCMYINAITIFLIVQEYS